MAVNIHMFASTVTDFDALSDEKNRSIHRRQEVVQMYGLNLVCTAGCTAKPKCVAGRTIHRLVLMFFLGNLQSTGNRETSILRLRCPDYFEQRGIYTGIFL